MIVYVAAGLLMQLGQLRWVRPEFEDATQGYWSSSQTNGWLVILQLNEPEWLLQRRKQKVGLLICAFLGRQTIGTVSLWFSEYFIGMFNVVISEWISCKYKQRLWIKNWQSLIWDLTAALNRTCSWANHSTYFFQFVMMALDCNWRMQEFER